MLIGALKAISNEAIQNKSHAQMRALFLHQLFVKPQCGFKGGMAVLTGVENFHCFL